MHISLVLKLSIWRLKSGEWQLISQLSMPFINYVLLAMNPFDSETLYLLKKMNYYLTSTNLHKGNLDHTSDSNTLIFAGEWEAAIKCHYLDFPMFVLPPWLYMIPSTPSWETLHFLLFIFQIIFLEQPHCIEPLRVSHIYYFNHFNITSLFI